MEWEGKGLQRGDEEKESQEEGEMRARWMEPYKGRQIEWEDQREGKGSGGQGGGGGVTSPGQFCSLAPSTGSSHHIHPHGLLDSQIQHPGFRPSETVSPPVAVLTSFGFPPCPL